MDSKLITVQEIRDKQAHLDALHQNVRTQMFVHKKESCDSILMNSEDVRYMEASYQHTILGPKAFAERSNTPNDKLKLCGLQVFRTVDLAPGEIRLFKF